MESGMQLIGSPPPARKVIRLVGSGGMGVVYEAIDERLDRRVALKALHPHLTNTPETRDRLLREARLAARVEHENVVRIYAIHEDEDGLCLEMQFIEGTPLSKLLKGHPLTPSQASDLLRQVLEALVACHAKNVIHGDLKPGNLLVTEEGRVMLADFGIARAIYPETGESPLLLTTTSGNVWGTPQYCPPEALEGAAPDARWDLYALGILVYEALTGALPFEGQTPALIMREKMSGAQSPIADTRNDLSQELASLVDSLAAPDPEERPQSAAAALALLQEVPELGTDTLTTCLIIQRDEDRSSKRSSKLELLSLPSTPISGIKSSGQKAGRLALAVLLASLAVGAYLIAPRGGNDVIPPPNKAEGKPGDIGKLIPMRYHTVFSYDDGVRGRELWAASHNGAVTMVADINPGPGSSNPKHFVTNGVDSVLFSATRGDIGSEPWLLNANPLGARVLADLVPGKMHSDPVPVAPQGAGFLFYAKTVPAGEELWITDTHENRTGRLVDLYPEVGDWANPPSQVYFDKTRIVYYRKTSERSLLLSLNLHDFSVDELGTISSGNQPDRPHVGEIKFLGDTCIFGLYTPQDGNELRRLSPGMKNAELIKDIWPGSGSSDPTEFCEWNGEIYFRANSPEHGIELWKTDGTPEGTIEVSDLIPGSEHGSPSNFVATRDRLFFRATYVNSGLELMALDNAAGSQPVVFDINPGLHSSTPYSLRSIGNFVFFSADDGVHGEEFWAIDATDPTAKPELVRDIKDGPESSEPHTLTRIDNSNGLFVYKTERGEGLMQLWTADKEYKLSPCDPLPLK